MQRWLVRANWALFVCLFALVVVNARAVVARNTSSVPASAALVPGALRWVATDPERPGVGLVDFGTLMVPIERLGEPIPPRAIVLEPAAKVALRWHSPSQLAVTALEPLRRATTYTLHFGDGFRSLDGRPLAKDTRLQLDTAPPALVGTTCDEDAKGGIVRVTFDLPVTRESLAAHAHLTDATDKPVPFTIEDQEAGADGKCTFGLRFAAGASTVHLRIATGLLPKVGNVPLATECRQTLVLRAPLAATRIHAATRRILIGFNHAIPLPDARLITVQPAVPFQVERDDGRLCLIGDWKPGTAVAVTLEEGFPGSGRFLCSAKVRLSTRVPDLRPELGFADRGSVISALAHLEIPVKGVNVPGFEVGVRTVYPNNVVRMLQSQQHRWQDTDAEVFTPLRTKTVRIQATHNEHFLERVDLRDVLGTGDPKPAFGFHEVQVRSLDSHLAERRIVQITDLGLSVRTSADTIAIRVRSLARGSPVAEAFVQVLTGTNQDLCSGTTDADGVVLMRFVRNASDRVPFAVFASSGEDRACVDLTGFAVDLSGDELDGREFLARDTGEIEALVHLDRGAIRPGETVAATALVRDDAGRARAGRRYEFSLHGPGRGSIKAASVVDEGHGLLAFEHVIPGDAPTGAWRIDLTDMASKRVVASAAFRVEAFVPDRLEVTGRTQEAWQLGTRQKLAVKGTWLDGTPAAGLDVTATVRFEAARTPVAGHEGWSFQPVDRRTPPGALQPTKVALDGKGQGAIAFEIPKPKGLQRMVARVGLELADPSGRVVRGETSTPVEAALGLVGIRADKVGAEVVLVGEPHASTPLVVRLERRHWTWELRSHAGRSSYVSEVVSDLVEEFSLDGAGSVRWKTALPEDAWYVASVTRGTGDDLQLAEQTIGEAVLPPDTLRLGHAPNRVRPGETVALAIEAPFAGTAFVTLESTSVHKAYVHEVPAGHSTLPVAIPTELTTPNVHVVVTLTRAIARRDASGPVWICGATSLLLAHPERTTDVVVDAPARVAPESRVEIRVHAPGAARATIALVDEGVLRLTGHPDPDPAGHFLARRKLRGQGADAGPHLAQDLIFDAGVLVGGDDDEAGIGARLQGSITETIRSVALRSGVVRLDTNGTAAIAFTLPPFEGRVRVVAIAAGAAVVGAAVRPLVVAGPVGVQVAVPRHAVPGDELEAIVTLRNSTGAARALDVALAAKGAELAPGVPASRRIELGDGASTSFAVRLRTAKDPGAATLLASVQADGFTAKAEGEVPVRHLLPFRTDRVGIACEGRQEIRVPTGFTADSIRARLVLDGDPSARLLGLAESLIEYPYGCAEQTASRCFALLACRSLLPALHQEGRGVDPTSHLESGVARLLTMQTRSGGLGLWPGMRQASPFCSVHALEVLHGARAAGSLVPEDSLQALENYVERLLAKSTDRALRCFAAATLASAGKPVRGWLARFEEEATSDEERTLLALAHARLGDKEATLRLLAPPPARRAQEATASTSARSNADEDESDAGPVYGANMLHSSAERRDAWTLRALLLVAPGDARVPLLARTLETRAVASGGWNTQDAGQILVALAAYDQVRGSRAGASSATLEHAGASLRLVKGKRCDVPVTPGETLVLASDGPVWGLVTFSGFGSAPHDEEDPTLTVTMALRRDGKPVTTLERGERAELVLGCETERGADDLLLICPLPAGLEPDGDAPRCLRPGAAPREVLAGRCDVRDDRVLWFSCAQVPARVELVIPVRATFVGTFSTGRGTAELLYTPGSLATAPALPTVTVTAKKP